MKGVIVANQGESRYSVSIAHPTVLLEQEIARVTRLYDQAQRDIIHWTERRAEALIPYNAAMSAMYAAMAAYRSCIDAASMDECRRKRREAYAQSRANCRRACQQ